MVKRHLGFKKFCKTVYKTEIEKIEIDEIVVNMVKCHLGSQT